MGKTKNEGQDEPRQKNPKKKKPRPTQKTSFTKAYDDIFESAMQELKGERFKLFYLVYRQTIGWNTYSDRISISQFVKATGLSRRGVINTIEALEKQKWIYVMREETQGGMPYKVYSLGKAVYRLSDREKAKIEQFEKSSEESSLLSENRGKQKVVKKVHYSDRKVVNKVHPLKKEEFKDTKISLSLLVTGFYTGIGQNRISKNKRERASNILKELRGDGFSLEDIAFAVEWTLDNAKEEVYDFSIIQHTIGQAIAARDKIELERKAMEKRDKAIEQERLERETEDREVQEIETHKVSLSPEAREELREKAHAELIKSGVSAGVITDFLLKIKENELLRTELEQKSAVIPSQTKSK